MRKSIFIGLLVVLLNSISFPAFSFWDFLNPFNLIKQLNKYMTDYKDVWGDINSEIYIIIEKQKSENVSRAYAQELMKQEDVEMFKPDIDDVLTILETPFYKDVQGLDPYREVWQDKNKAAGEFEYLEKNTRNLQDNIFYRGSIKNQIDEKVKLEKDYIDSLNIRLDECRAMREFETQIWQRIKEYDELLENITSEEKNPSNRMSEAKILAVMNYISYDLIKIKGLIKAALRSDLAVETRNKVDGMGNDQQYRKNDQSIIDFLKGGN